MALKKLLLICKSLVNPILQLHFETITPNRDYSYELIPKEKSYSHLCEHRRRSRVASLAKTKDHA
ncbi:unnamed protein product [Chondrus crispus]|uniref:Uncharacterized protein n=1 Tax=Chondrus crispus TaxID=2769 RepID=R7Q3D7_CHOCR|nr:unnamed protein product [Chondrus crispus]CDF32413.1 unnamed protein product [Chondrus crispus]|eukprot:XP_005712078.1 unnamed protein product [Chondrus crispus]